MVQPFLPPFREPSATLQVGHVNQPKAQPVHEPPGQPVGILKRRIGSALAAQPFEDFPRGFFHRVRWFPAPMMAQSCAGPEIRRTDLRRQAVEVATGQRKISCKSGNFPDPEKPARLQDIELAGDCLRVRRELIPDLRPGLQVKRGLQHVVVVHAHMLGDRFRVRGIAGE